MDSRSISKEAALSRLRKPQISIEDMWSGILLRDKVALGKAVSIIESQSPQHQEWADVLIQKCISLPSSECQKIGITGVPGVGKSTFINAYTQLLVNQGSHVAILAVDPSSQQSKGSILGDKTRMADIFAHPNVFIRPSPSGQQLGGVASKTREIILLCEAAGYDKILVETVGVGQSETAVQQMTDIFILLMLAGAGDELQGIKRGIMEWADLLIVHKADGDNVVKAQKAANAYKRALHLFPPSESQWIPAVLTASSESNIGLDKIHDKINAYFQWTISNGYLQQKRSQQWQQWLEDSIDHIWRQTIQQHTHLSEKYQQLANDVLQRKISPPQGARLFVEYIINNGSR